MKGYIEPFYCSTESLSWMWCPCYGRRGRTLLVRVGAASIANALSELLPGFLGHIRVIQSNAIELVILQLLQVQERVVRTVNGADDLIQLDLQRLGIAIFVYSESERPSRT